MGRLTGYFTLALVQDGNDGITPTVWKIVPSQSSLTFTYNSDGVLTGTQTFDIKVIEQHGEDVTVHTSEPGPIYTYSGWDNGSTLYSNSYHREITADLATKYNSITIEIWNGSKPNGTMVDRVSVAIVKNGKPGKPGRPGSLGPKMRIRDWSSGGVLYCEGKEGESFYDVVVYDKKLYLCVKTHNSSSITPPVSISQYEGRWEAAQDWAFVATKLLLSEKIKADQIDANGLTASDVLLTGAFRSPWHNLAYRVISSSAQGDQWGFDGSGDFYDHIRLIGVVAPGAELELPWGIHGNGRFIYVDNSTNNDVYINIPSGKSIYIIAGRATSKLKMTKNNMYLFIGFGDYYYGLHLIGRKETIVNSF